MDIKNNEYYLLKISEFLDGELTPEETHELFSVIADNPELQDELKSSMAVRNMFHQELIPPPKESKIMLYGKLNLQKTAVLLSLLLSIFTQLRRFILNPAVGATLVGVGIFLMGYFTSEFAKKQDNTNLNNAIVAPKVINQNKENIPVVSSKELPDNSNQTIAKFTRKPTGKKLNTNLAMNNSSISFDNPTEIINTSNSLNEEELHSSNLSNDDYERLIYSALLGKNNQLLNVSATKGTYTEVDYLISSFLDKMSLAITKSNNSSNIKNDLEPLSNPMLNDYSVAIGYNLNENSIIAIEFGQENYPQRYTGVINQSDAVINQVYTAQWYGLSYQYNFDNISNKILINPFIKVLSSLTKVGPLFKGSFGLNYSVNDKLILNVGLESSTLIYEFQGNRFNTMKYGIFYGAKLNF